VLITLYYMTLNIFYFPSDKFKNEWSYTSSHYNVCNMNMNIVWVMQLNSQPYHICNAVQPTSFTMVLINLFAACRSSGFLLCSNFCSNRDLSSSSKIEFLGRGGGAATGTSFWLVLMYGGSSCKSDEMWVTHTDTVFKIVNNIKIVYKNLKFT